MQRRWNHWHMHCWHETNQFLVSKQGRKQITGTMTCSKAASNALGLNNQDSINDTCPADVEHIIIWLAKKQHSKKNNLNSNLFKANRQWKRNNTNGVCCWHWTDHYVVETYVMTSKYYLAQVICRGIWLCNLTYPVICRLTMTKSDLRQTNKVLNIIQKKLQAEQYTIRTTIYEMTWSLSSVLNLHRSDQLKLNSDVSWTVKLSQKINKGKCEPKRHQVTSTMQQTRSNRQNRVWHAQKLWTENKLCKEHNQRQFLWTGTSHSN